MLFCTVLVFFNIFARFCHFISILQHGILKYWSSHFFSVLPIFGHFLHFFVFLERFWFSVGFIVMFCSRAADLCKFLCIFAIFDDFRWFFAFCSVTWDLLVINSHVLFTIRDFTIFIGILAIFWRFLWFDIFCSDMCDFSWIYKYVLVTIREFAIFTGFLAKFWRFFMIFHIPVKNVQFYPVLCVFSEHEPQTSRFY